MNAMNSKFEKKVNMGTRKSIAGDLFILKLGTEEIKMFVFPSSPLSSTTETKRHNCKIFLKCNILFLPKIFVC